MTETKTDDSNIIYFHFDTVESKLSITSFNQLVDSLNIATNNISQVFIGEKVKCSVFILPPEDGSFKSKFCIFLAGAALSGPIGNYRCVGLTLVDRNRIAASSLRSSSQ